MDGGVACWKDHRPKPTKPAGKINKAPAASAAAADCRWWRFCCSGWRGRRGCPTLAEEGKTRGGWRLQIMVCWQTTTSSKNWHYLSVISRLSHWRQHRTNSPTNSPDKFLSTCRKASHNGQLVHELAISCIVSMNVRLCTRPGSR